MRDLFEKTTLVITLLGLIMLKNLYLPLFFAFVSSAFIACSSIDSSAAIIQAKKDIMIEVKKALILKEKAEQHFQNIFQDEYEAKKQICLNVLKNIANSSEFTSTLEHVTDEQIQLLTQEMIPYNNIISPPSIYPLQEKLEQELALASFNTQEEQLFNILYVVFAVISGTKLLLNKLDIAENQLHTQCTTLPATDSISQA